MPIRFEYLNLEFFLILEVLNLGGKERLRLIHTATEPRVFVSYGSSAQEASLLGRCPLGEDPYGDASKRHLATSYFNSIVQLSFNAIRVLGSLWLEFS